MAGGAIVGTLGLVGVATALPLFALTWAVAGSVMSAVLYPPRSRTLTNGRRATGPGTNRPHPGGRFASDP